MELEDLMVTLEKSIQKNGEKPLTNVWLLNLLKITSQRVEEEEFMEDFYNEGDHW